MRAWRSSAHCCHTDAPRTRVEGLGFRVSGFGFQVSGFGLRVLGSGFRVRVQGLGFRVQGLGFRELFSKLRGFKAYKGGPPYYTNRVLITLLPSRPP